MQPEISEPQTPPLTLALDWLRYARGDLALAQVPLTAGILLESLCFHLQQAAEKGLKAVLVRHGIVIPRTHNLRLLLDLIPSDIPCPETVSQAAALTDYAVMTRYPGEYEPVTADEYQAALGLAKAVVAWAEGLVSSC